jgi:RNA polymerase sigma-70 factor (ECF subfamily)
MPAAPLAGDFEERIRSELPGLLAYACALTRHGADAEDLVQETCLAAFEGRAAYDADRPLAGWLRGILRHKHIDALRRRREASLDASALEAIEAIHADLDQRPAGVDLLDALEACLGRLPPALRSVLERHHQEGAAVVDVAGELGLGTDAVKKRLQRARALLIACLRGRGFPVTEAAPDPNGRQSHGP